MAHFYERSAGGDIIPRHFVPMSSRPGESRPTRITDARKAGWYPSVTTIQGLLDKPALTDWKIQEHLRQAWRNPVYGANIPSESLDDYISRIKNLTEKQLERAPKDGTDFHDVLEKYFNSQDIPQEFAQTCDNVVRELEAVCGEQPWVTEKAFVHTMGFAGKCDIHSKVSTVGTASWVIDYKTKNTADKWKPGKMAYPEMAMQLSAYRVGLNLPDARCANVFICLEDGSVEFHEWDSAELDKQFANFADLLRIWLRNAEYVPGSKPAGNNS